MKSDDEGGGEGDRGEVRGREERKIEEKHTRENVTDQDA